MRFGICTGPENRDVLAEAGYDYIEPAVAGALRPEQPEEDVMPPLRAAFAASLLKPEAYNVLLPGDLKVVGPEVDAGRQERYLEAAFARAASLGGQIAVFGSGAARGIPEGWPIKEAQRQVHEFLGRGGVAAARHGITIAIEPLNLSECNFINSVAEAVALARAVNHPAVAVLSDLYHVDHDGQSYEETREAASLLRHVHVAGAVGRRAPVAADYEFLRDYLAVVKASGYDERISIEGSWDDLARQAPEALDVVRRAWEAA